MEAGQGIAGGIPEDVRRAGAVPLPRMQPLEPGDWLRIDGSYAAQMAEKARLLRERPGDVIDRIPGSGPLEAELRDMVLDTLAGTDGFRVSGAAVGCPDGREVAVAGDPLVLLARLIPEDVCLLERRGDEHVLVAAALCFPASWTLAEKIGRPLTAIHGPVPAYDAGIARRVQRFFDAVKPERPVWRANLLPYPAPDLYQPRSEKGPRRLDEAETPWLRSERQCVLRLPRTGGAVFSIRTYVEWVGGA